MVSTMNGYVGRERYMGLGPDLRASSYPDSSCLELARALAPQRAQEYSVGRSMSGLDPLRFDPK